jgi:signal transduction histidine kinase
MRSRPVRWPWLVLVGFFVSALVALVLVSINDESLAGQVPFVIAFSLFGVVGALILSRARNRIGSLMLYAAAATAIGFLAGEVMTYLVLRGTTTGPLVASAGVISSTGWVVGILPVLFFLPLLFPDGRLPSRRWLPLAILSFASLAFLAMGLLVGERYLTGNSDAIRIVNPLFVPGLGTFELSDTIINVFLIGALTGNVVSLIMRFRRARGVERQQIKWVAAALVLLVVSFTASSIATAFGAPEIVDTILSAGAFIALPISIAVSVLQYRLYDLDVVVKKALIAGTLVLLVVGVYGVLVVAFGSVASDGNSSVSLFAVALALGVAFRPVTRFARRLADRLVYGRRATPYEVLTEFSERMGDAYATDDVLGRMAQILGQGVGATGARVWLFTGRELRAASTWPADAPAADPVRLRDGEALEIPDEYAVEVRDRGELLGALSVRTAANDPMTPAREKLVRDLASQAGLALRNVRLVEDLKASQRRIVAAQDLERRRIERNIHDGAQQQLVALTVKMRLAQSLATKDAEKAAAMLEQMQAETQTALEDLRDLARGIYPPLLADQGLLAAIEAQIRKAGLAVEASADGVSRYPQEVESAVYFSVLEALQNVSKYAGASRVEVRLRERDGVLAFEVVDDGRGFDRPSTSYGTGLQGIADRMSALGGDVDVRSAPGAGTTVTGRIPVTRANAPDAIENGHARVDPPTPATVPTPETVPARTAADVAPPAMKGSA